MRNENQLLAPNRLSDGLEEGKNPLRKAHLQDETVKPVRLESIRD